MQIARRRDRYQEVAELLRHVPPSAVSITDYALHSLMNIARRHEMLAQLPGFIARSGFGVTVEVVTVTATRLGDVAEAIAKYQLDVDDAYQYIAAEAYGLKLVSLDADFDRTPNGRLTPAAALQLFQG